MIVAVLCTGPSLTQADVDHCRERCDKIVAVSDAIFMAPWADAMVAYDKAWWLAHREVKFKGPKYMSHPEKVRGLDDVELVNPGGGHSGTLGIIIAAREFSPDKIILLGADLKGTHFFGPHTDPNLRHTSKMRFKAMRQQFSAFRRLPIVNCSPDSELDCFRKADLRMELADLSQRAAV
ncbi:MAG: hypothetical protein WC710_13730 [Gallionella sp.]|jgi:hypothetical protein